MGRAVRLGPTRASTAHVVAAVTAAATLAGGAAAMLAAIAIVRAGAVLVAAVATLCIAVPVSLPRVDAFFEALEAVQDLVEFLFDAATSASIRLRSHPHALRHGGAHEDEDGKCGDSSHFAVVTPDCTSMFRKPAHFMTTRFLAGPDSRFPRRASLRALVEPSASSRLELENPCSPRRVAGMSGVQEGAVKRSQARLSLSRAPTAP